MAHTCNPSAREGKQVDPWAQQSTSTDCLASERPCTKCGEAVEEDDQC